MNCEKNPVADHEDWARGAGALLIWCMPGALLLVSPLIGVRYLVIVWPSLLTFMGAACLLNARRCGRIHCYLTGPFFLTLALIALLHGLGAVPLGANGWSILSVILVIGGALLTWGPERYLGQYRSSSI